MKRILALLLFGYVFFLFNPQFQQAPARVPCENGYAFRLESGDYVACEDFDAYFEARYNGQVRHDLIIKGR